MGRKKAATETVVIPAEAIVAAPSAAGVPSPEVTARAHHKDASDRLEVYQSFEIVDQETLDMASSELGAVKGLSKRLQEEKERATKPLNAALRAIRDWFRPAETVLSQCEGTLKEKVAGYYRAVDSANAQAVEAVQEAADRGDTEAATEALTTIQDAARTDGVSVTEVWAYRVCNIGMVPAEFLDIVPSRVRAAMNEMVARGEEPVIPGITFFKEQRVSARAK